MAFREAQKMWFSALVSDERLEQKWVDTAAFVVPFLEMLKKREGSPGQEEIPAGAATSLCSLLYSVLTAESKRGTATLPQKREVPSLTLSGLELSRLRQLLFGALGNEATQSDRHTELAAYHSTLYKIVKARDIESVRKKLSREEAERLLTFLRAFIHSHAASM